MNSTGSPTKRNRAKAISPTASITTTAWARRRRMKASMGILLASRRAFLPQLPRPLERAAIGGARAPALLVAEEFDRALELPGLQLEPRVHLGVDGAEHRLRHAVADHGHAMTAHQDATASAQLTCQSLPERPIAYQQIVLGAHCPDFKHRRPGPQERTHVVDRPQLCVRDAERDHRGRMAMHDRHHVRPSAVDLAMNIAFDEYLAALARQRLAVRVELHHVRRRDQRRGARARHEEAVRAAVAAGTDMAVGVEHLVRGEDAARGGEILDQRAARPPP